MPPAFASPAHCSMELKVPRRGNVWSASACRLDRVAPDHPPRPPTRRWAVRAPATCEDRRTRPGYSAQKPSTSRERLAQDCRGDNPLPADHRALLPRSSRSTDPPPRHRAPPSARKRARTAQGDWQRAGRATGAQRAAARPSSPKLGSAPRPTGRPIASCIDAGSTLCRRVAGRSARQVRSKDGPGPQEA